MPAAVGLLLFVVLGGLLLWALGRNLELARVRVRDGAVEVVRGRLPPDLLGDMRDVLKSAHVARTDIRIIVEDRRPRLVAKSLGADATQQLRNVMGGYTVSQIRAGRGRRS
jgi:hypothetical protein